MFRIEQLERRIQGEAVTAAPADSPPSSSPPQSPKQTRALAAPATAPAVEAVAEPATQAEVELETIVRLWPAVLEATGEDPMLGAALAETHPIALENGRLVIGFPPDTDFIRKKAEAKRDVIQRAIHGLTGATLVIALETSQHAAPLEQKTLTTDELIDSVKRDFGAVEVQDESVEN
jgi:hypothetical protein